MWCGKKERNGREEDDGKFNYLHRVCLLPSHYLFCLRSAFDFELFKHHQICIDVVLWVLYQYLTEESKVDLRENNTQRMKVRKCCDAAKHINLCIERVSSGCLTLSIALCPLSINIKAVATERPTE